MKKAVIVLMATLSSLGGLPAQAEETLSQWAASFSTAETQLKLLGRIFPDRFESTTSPRRDSKEGTYLFEQGNSWVQLAQDLVWKPADTSSSSSAYLIVTCLMRRAPESEPYSAASYFFRDAQRRPVSISQGYANRERLDTVAPPGFSQSFLLLRSMTTNSAGTLIGETASLFQVDLVRTDNPLRPVWTSKPSLRYFRLGFAVLHEGQTEDLVLKIVPPPAPSTKMTSAYDIQGSPETTLPLEGSSFLAYRWNGQRFEEDDTVFEGRLKALPETVWSW